MARCLIFYLGLLMAICHGSSNTLSDSASHSNSHKSENRHLDHGEECQHMERVIPRIRVSQGVLEGRLKITKTGFEYKSFQGIPYARPPIGEQRFRDPRPAGKWKGILNAAEVGSACTQFDPLFTNKYYGQEDCLFLNVYVPKTAVNNRRFPVMVWIHGGGFIVGDGSPELYGPDYLVEKNVIVVTLNYRLGVFGFLTLNSQEVPGNAGLKDQSLALKWVKENIRSFNGDEDNITIFGESAGAASVHYQMLSPMSRGLFNRAIIQSGAATCLWALQKHPERVPFKLAEQLGFTTNSSDDVLAFLRTVPNKDLAFAAISPSFVGSIQLTFAPTTEKKFPNTEAFITRTPQEVLRSGDFQKMPLLGGLLTVEGLIYRTTGFQIPADSDAVNNNYVPDLTRFVPDELIAKYGVNGVDEIVTKIQQFYFPTTDNIGDGLKKLYSDFLFVKDVAGTLSTYAEQSSTVYYYEFTYSGSRNLLKFLTGFNYTGAAHTDELGYLFNISLQGIDQIPPTENDTLVTKRMVEMWTNFAKNADPTPVKSDILPTIWKPLKHKKVYCLNIDKELKMINDPFAERVQFWKNIYNM